VSGARTGFGRANGDYGAPSTLLSGRITQILIELVLKLVFVRYPASKEAILLEFRLTATARPPMTRVRREASLGKP